MGPPLWSSPKGMGPLTQSGLSYPNCAPAHNFLKRPQRKLRKPWSPVEIKKSNYIIRLFSGSIPSMWLSFVSKSWAFVAYCFFTSVEGAAFSKRAPIIAGSVWLERRQNHKPSSFHGCIALSVQDQYRLRRRLLEYTGDDCSCSPLRNGPTDRPINSRSHCIAFL